MDDDESWHLKQIQIQFQLMLLYVAVAFDASHSMLIQFDEFFNYAMQNS
jgi:hypothetical protein